LDTGASSSQIKWAIGGYSLHLNKTYTCESQYLADINGSGSASSCTPAQANTENAYRLNLGGTVPRTAIGWDGSKIVLAVFQSEKAYEVRQFMKNEGCTMAVMLDGGGSSQMRFLVASPSGNFVGTYDPSGENRSVYNMVAVNPTQWIYQY